MKNILLSAFALMLTLSQAQAQCTPDVSITTPGIYPDTITNLPLGTVNVFYDTDIQLRILTDTTIAPGLDVTVIDITVDSVGGLPAGFSYACNPVNCVFEAGTNGCIRLSGTNANAGVYDLSVYVTFNGELFGFPVSAPAIISGYRIELIGAAIPVADFSASTNTLCEDLTVTFTDQSLNNPTSWFWTFQGGTLPNSTDQNPEVLYSTPGVYDVTLVATNAAGSDTVVQTGTITVNAKPLAKITPTGIVEVCAGQSTVLTANPGAGFTYQWFRYGNLLVGETAQTLNTNQGGQYKVKVTDTAVGCTKRSGLRTVQVNALPVVSITAQGPTTFCKNASVVLEAIGSPGFTYQWTAGGVDIPGATNPTYTATTSEYYRVRATDANGCSKLSPGTVTATLPLPNNAITESGPLSFCVGDSVILSASPVAGNTFQWEENFISIPGETDPDYTAFTSGKYTFTVTGTNGCSRRSAVRNVDVNCRMMGISEALPLDVNVFPNPANEYFRIELSVPESGNATIELFDMTGKMVETLQDGNMEKGIYTLETSTDDLMPGLYLIRTTVGNQVVNSRLMID